MVARQRCFSWWAYVHNAGLGFGSSVRHSPTCWVRSPPPQSSAKPPGLQCVCLLLPQEDGPRLVQLVGAAAAVHPEGSQPSTGLPGEAETCFEGGDGRQVEESAIAAQVEGDAAIFLVPHVELVVVGGAVGKQDDLPLDFQLSGHTHAQSERAQAHFLLGDEHHEAEVCLNTERPVPSCPGQL